MKIDELKKAYTGPKVRFYEEKRKHQKTWEKEQKIVREFLKRISRIHNKNLTVLDIPVGTGRFFEFYKELDFSVIGVDISEDMLKEAKKKIKQLKLNAKLEKGNITNITFQGRSVDLVVCIRILNLLDFDNFSKALSEFVRVADKYIICGVIVYPSLKDESVLGRINISSRRILSNLLTFIKRNSGTIRHPENQVLDQFRRESLIICDKIRADTGRGGYAYYIYYLKK